MAVQVAVCGPARCSEAERRDAYRLGELLAAQGAVVLCGGGPGAMAAVAAGARAHGGTVVGGSWGTLSEYAIAMRTGVPLVTLGGWQVRDASGQPVPGPVRVEDPESAVRAALSAAGG